MSATGRAGRVTMGDAHAARCDSDGKPSTERQQLKRRSRAGRPDWKALSRPAGDRIPPSRLSSKPSQRRPSRRFSLDVNVQSTSGAKCAATRQSARTGRGLLPGPWVRRLVLVNVGARFSLARKLDPSLRSTMCSTLVRRPRNRADRVHERGTFIARPFPAVAGQFPVRQTTLRPLGRRANSGSAFASGRSEGFDLAQHAERDLCARIFRIVSDGKTVAWQRQPDRSCTLLATRSLDCW